MGLFFGAADAAAGASGADQNWDVKVRIFSDQYCIEEILNGVRYFAPSLSDSRAAPFARESVSVLGGNTAGASASAATQIICYANTFSNISLAFDLSIVRFYEQFDPVENRVVPRKVNL